MTRLDDAGVAIATGPFCDSCLGRLVADRSFGLTNTEREPPGRNASPCRPPTSQG